eukprot:TRINITY_DN2361_c0_g1_i1.p1 TRINITY_DN2361_c0_g1~~TRINITY_DN2361_c0_g1_i1.p1  ORF type:complete len:244 (-),score=56.78 TRINITY_DN2361_c0_g1_i1:43-774(-)
MLGYMSNRLPRASLLDAYTLPLVLHRHQHALVLYTPTDNTVLEREFNTLAAIYELDRPWLLVAYIRCADTPGLCTEKGITKPVALLHLSDGSEVVYDGEIKIEALLSFVNEKCNLFRSIDGNLLPTTAGRVSALDELLFQFLSTQVPTEKDAIIAIVNVIDTSKDDNMDRLREAYVSLMTYLRQQGNDAATVHSEVLRLGELHEWGPDRLGPVERDIIGMRLNIARGAEEYLLQNAARTKVDL